MNWIFLFLALLCNCEKDLVQAKPIVGAWIWGDSKKDISMFIENNGKISISIRKKGEQIQAGNTREGRYVYNKHIITTIWPPNQVIKFELKLLNNGSIQVRNFKDLFEVENKTLIFNRVVDEEE